MSSIDEKTVIDCAPEDLWQRLLDPSVFISSFSDEYAFTYDILPASFADQGMLKFEMSRWYVGQEWQLKSHVNPQKLELELTQEKGPFKKWRLFIKIEAHSEGKSVLTESLTYKMPFSVLGSLVDDVFLRRDLRQQLKKHQSQLRSNS